VSNQLRNQEKTTRPEEKRTAGTETFSFYMQQECLKKSEGSSTRKTGQQCTDFGQRTQMA